MNLKKAFRQYCQDKDFQINKNQLEIINSLEKFNDLETGFFKYFRKLKKKELKLVFYLSGDVGVGKTMILNFYFNFLNISKKKFHFNEFMIKFHEYRHKNKELGKNNSIETFVKGLKKKFKLIFFDEFQVTNIVDAMILGKLFQNILKENIKIILTSNSKIEDLYKDGLQREQFIPFISIIKKFSIINELVIDEDYRKKGIKKLERFLYPINEETNFKINQLFRELTKGKKLTSKKLQVKGREFIIKNYYDGIAKFEFEDLCDKNIGAEDYICIAQNCILILIQNIPNFDNYNINQQQRFITLIDIIYEKRIPLILSSNFKLSEFKSSIALNKPFKRTISRIYELTSPNINIS
tara:strand:+ start:897 stop:1955 length:1059 start_codon:yes stop_codon:yes gene_type:complete